MARRSSRGSTSTLLLDAALDAALHVALYATLDADSPVHFVFLVVLLLLSLLFPGWGEKKSNLPGARTQAGSFPGACMLAAALVLSALLCAAHANSREQLIHSADSFSVVGVSKSDLRPSDSPLMVAAGLLDHNADYEPQQCFAAYVVVSSYLYLLPGTSLLEATFTGRFHSGDSTQFVCVLSSSLHKHVIALASMTTPHGIRQQCRFTEHLHSTASDLKHYQLHLAPQAAFGELTNSLLSNTSIAFTDSGKFCLVPIRTMIRHHKPHMYLVSVSSLKNPAAFNFKEWILFHLRVGYDHMVIYDDCSTDNMRDIIYPFHKHGLVTYIDACTITMKGDFPGFSRQYACMNDFHIRFGSQTEFVIQQDNDLWYHAPPSDQDKDVPRSLRQNGEQHRSSPVDVNRLRQRLKYLQSRHPSVSQFHIYSKWFGACNATQANPHFILQDLPEGGLTYEYQTYRYSPISFLIPWVSPNVPSRVMTHTSFALSRDVIGVVYTHMWAVEREVRFVDPRCIVNNHYKVLPWSLHQKKNEATWAGSKADTDLFRAMNRHLCKMEDLTLASAARLFRDWYLTPIEEISRTVRQRKWPLPEANSHCDEPPDLPSPPALTELELLDLRAP
eukprot:m.400228 g.400228  ORF g.400228 m.400228 type:complete len:616 (+) comp56439_c0_seq19:1594-3441(+)